MNYYLLLTLIPVLITIVWALIVKLKRKQIFDALTILICAVAAITNGFVVYGIVLNGSCNPVLHFIQLLFSSSIVPLAYLYFSRQLGRKWNNLTSVLCWGLMIFLLLPNVVIFVGQDKTILDPDQILMFKVHVINNGRVVFSCHTADIIILIQAILTAIRIIPAAKTMKKYGLKLSNEMAGFFIWWIAAILFIIYSSFISTETLISTLGSWTYFILYSLLICSIYTLIALRFDLYPVMTSEDGDAVNVDDFIQAHKVLADDLNRLLKDKKVYLEPGFTSEKAVAMLGTNRTYFSRMMKAEFGVKFTDLLNEYRIKTAKDLLSKTNKSITDVAFESGFSDASYMSKKFSALVGMSPRSYREEYSVVL